MRRPIVYIPLLLLVLAASLILWRGTVRTHDTTAPEQPVAMDDDSGDDDSADDDSAQ
jgi:hypothetical protein